MTAVVPQPTPDDPPVNKSTQVALNPGERATVTLTPETAGNTHRIPIVAISGQSAAHYTVSVDGNERYGPAGSPPTDPSDLSVTFVPALRLKRHLKVTIRDLRTSGGSRPFTVQVVGWEARNGT